LSYMTHIIIHPKQQVRINFLLELVSKLFEKEISDFTVLEKNPDVHIVSAESSIGIDSVKNLQKEMLFQPFQEKVQVAVIDNAQLLTVEAQNALLKTLEEPSPTSEYILMVDNQKNLLDTILSRGTRYYATSNIEDEETGEPQILEMDISDRFALVEKIVKEGDIDEFTNTLLKYFRGQLRSNANGNTTEIQEKIS